MAKREQWSDVCTQTNTCALTGAASFFAGIPESHVLVNGPNWCYFYALRHIEKAVSFVANRIQCTQVNNQDIVYGTEERVLEMLDEIKKTPPSILLLENSCSVSLIGDDLLGITRRAKLPFPVVCLDSGGLSGGFREGYQLAGERFFETVTIPKKPARKKAVNLLGTTYNYLNGKNDVEELKKILKMAGYEVLASPGAGSTMEEITRMGEASLNIVIHSELGMSLAKLLEEQLGIPYLSPVLPYGIEGTRRWIREITKAVPSDITELEEYLRQSEYRIFGEVNELNSIWSDLWFEQVAVFAPSSVAFGLSKALRTEWADMKKLTLILQDVPDQIPPDHEADEILFAEQDQDKFEKTLKEIRHGLIFGGSGEKNLLARQGISAAHFLNICYPIYDELFLIDQPFMGVRGTFYLLQRLWNCKIQHQEITNSTKGGV